MIQFGDLNIQKTEPKKEVKAELILVDTKEYNNKPNIQYVTSKLDFKKDILGKAPKKSKEELRLIEPGNKIGTGDFPTLAIFCDQCERVTGHACKSINNKKICLICKTVSKLARNGQK